MLILEPSQDPSFGVIDVFSMLHRRFTCVRLSHPYMTQSSLRLLTMTFTTAPIGTKQLMAV
jgi:hypothetical protein